MMILLPWIAFGLMIFLIIRQGTKAKREYLRDAAIEKKIEEAERNSLPQMLGQRGQGQSQYDPSEALMGVARGQRLQ
jgi:hypothetical protein